jgi:acyl carrier protein
MSETMTDTELEKDVIETIAKIARVPVERLKPEIDLRKDLRFDSLLGLKVLAGLEKRYGVTVPDEEIDKYRTVGAAVGMVKKLVLSQKGK